MSPHLPPLSALSVDDVTLEWIKLAATNAVSPEFAETVRADIYRDEVWGRLTHQLTAQVLAERLPSGHVEETKTFTIDVPASPWQQFKQDHETAWWLRWLTKWRPPLLRTHRQSCHMSVDITRYWSYPEARIARQLGRPVRVAMLNPVANWWTDS